MHLTKNYSTDGGDRIVIGGVLEFEQGAEVKNFPDGGGGTGGKAENQGASTATAVAGLKNDFNALLVRLKEAGLMAADEWELSARLAPSLTDAVAAVNNAKASVSLADGVITVTADVDELEESESSAPGQGTHKWIGLGIGTGLSSVAQAKYNGAQLTDADAEEAVSVGLDQPGEFVLYGTSLHAYYQTPVGDQYECETLLNVQAMTVPIEVIGQIIGEDLGLSFNDDLPSDFWDGFYPQDVPYIPADGDYYVTTDTYSSIVDYLSGKGAFADYQQYGDIPFMILPAGRYVSADGQYSIEARADIYIIAAMEKRNGRPETLPSPSCVDYPYTNLYAYNQIQVLTFTLNASDYIKCNPGLKGGYNSATSGICRKMAGLGLPDVDDDTMYTNYVTFPSDSIVNIPGILALPWCWYDNLPHDLATLKNIVQHGSAASGCEGITHTGKVPYLTYSKGSLYEEVKEQFPELFGSNVTYGGTEYVKVQD